jgi:cysteinyl-tRNA synthetase
MEIKLTNTLARQKEAFQPIQAGKVGIYSCGPTVYATPHIGNFRAFIFADLLRRSFEFLDYEVTQVMNITDVGHLTSDSDAGEDKLEKGAKREGISPLDVARKYEKEFFRDMEKINIKKPSQSPRASEHIEEQIALIKKLEAKGFTYETSDGIYFDTTKFENYGKLGGQKIEDKEAGKRVEVKSEKKNPADFALWKFCVGENKKHILRWKNPSGEGEGFPGWHLECSAMSSKYLGETFDIHTGGVDHIPVHHENEIAQSEAASGKKFVNYWLHNEFLTVDGGKMSKSLGNLFTIEDIEKKEIDPLAFRYLALNSHYRSKLNFTWEALKNANHSLNNLRTIFRNIPSDGDVDTGSLEKFQKALADDLNSPKALAIAWEYARSDAASQPTLNKFDEVLGLNLGKTEEVIKLDTKQKQLLEERKTARASKDFAKSDKIRDQFAALGLEIEDSGDGEQIVKKKL